jgi:hypothetical protein
MAGKKSWIARSALNRAIKAGNQITFEEYHRVGAWAELEVGEVSKIIS